MYNATDEVIKELEAAKMFSEHNMALHKGTNSRVVEIEKWHNESLCFLIDNVSPEAFIEYLQKTSIKYIDDMCRVDDPFDSVEFDNYLNWRVRIMYNYDIKPL
jgi:hypothetical protein